MFKDIHLLLISVAVVASIYLGYKEIKRLQKKIKEITLNLNELNNISPLTNNQLEYSNNCRKEKNTIDYCNLDIDSIPNNIKYNNSQVNHFDAYSELSDINSVVSNNIVKELLDENKNVEENKKECISEANNIENLCDNKSNNTSDNTSDRLSDSESDCESDNTSDRLFDNESDNTSDRLSDILDNDTHSDIENENTIDNTFKNNEYVKILDSTVADSPAVDDTLVNSNMVDDSEEDGNTVEDTLLDSNLVEDTLVDSTLVDSTLVDSNMVDGTLLDSTLLDSTLLDSTLVDGNMVDNSEADDNMADGTVLDDKYNNLIYNIPNPSLESNNNILEETEHIVSEKVDRCITDNNTNDKFDLNTLNLLTVKQLRIMAQEKNIYISTKTVKNEIINKIINYRQ